MTISNFSAELESRIQRHYRDNGYHLGWRLLESPTTVLADAKVALIGLNPGGHNQPDEHAEFAMPCGSAFVKEKWYGGPPGKGKLQKEVLELFKILGQKPEDVLAGSLVPFRSQSWNEFPKDKKNSAMAFGKKLWHDIIHRVRPSLVITYGNEPFQACQEILDTGKIRQYELEWPNGSGSLVGRRCAFPNGELIGLPHLSRFAVVTNRRKHILQLLDGYIHEDSSDRQRMSC